LRLLKRTLQLIDDLIEYQQTYGPLCQLEGGADLAMDVARRVRRAGESVAESLACLLVRDQPPEKSRARNALRQASR
jgi:hypothetical protein